MTREQYFLRAGELRRQAADAETDIERHEALLADARDRLRFARAELGNLKLPDAGDYVGRDDD